MKSCRPLKLLLAILALSLGACSTYKPLVQLGEIPPVSVPQKVEVVSTRAAVDGMLQKEGYAMIKKGQELQRAKAVFSKLTKTLTPGDPPWPVYLVDAKGKVNASAVNSNSVIVYRDLLVKVKSDAELAVILAHELGHILANHRDDDSAGSKRIGLDVGGYLLGSVAATAASLAGAGGFSNTIGSITDSAVQIVGEGALIKSFDRAQEYEADQIGIMIMAKAGYDPAVAPALWRRADEIFANDGGFLSTHPASIDRADELDKALPKAMEYYNAAKAPGGNSKIKAKKA